MQAQGRLAQIGKCFSVTSIEPIVAFIYLAFYACLVDPVRYLVQQRPTVQVGVGQIILGLDFSNKIFHALDGRQYVDETYPRVEAFRDEVLAGVWMDHCFFFVKGSSPGPFLGGLLIFRQYIFTDKEDLTPAAADAAQRVRSDFCDLFSTSQLLLLEVAFKFVDFTDQ